MWGRVHDVLFLAELVNRAIFWHNCLLEFILQLREPDQCYLAGPVVHWLRALTLNCYTLTTVVSSAANWEDGEQVLLPGDINKGRQGNMLLV